MAYEATEWLFQVRGAVGGSESWNNTWCVEDLVGAQNPQEAGSRIAAFYEDICGFASWLSTTYTVVGCTAKNLLTGATQEMTGFSFAGSSSAEQLPGQLGMRISLSGPNGARGGPFLTGFVVTAVDSTLIATSCVSDFAGAFETMTAGFTSDDWTLRINSPTTDTVKQVTIGRIGRRWDVIRKRGNDTPEAYTSVDVA